MNSLQYKQELALVREQNIDITNFCNSSKICRASNSRRYQKIFEESLEDKHKFVFGKLSNNASISIPVDGNRFFNKHIAIVGSTGSGKWHSVAKIIQEVIDSKEGKYDGLNNSHIVIFDIHSEYKTAFPKANMIDVNNLVLPYWLLNSDELQEMFLDTEANDHNQRNVFKQSVVDSRKNHFTGDEEQKN